MTRFDLPLVVRNLIFLSLLTAASVAVSEAEVLVSAGAVWAVLERASKAGHSSLRRTLVEKSGASG